jgi:peptidoglycan/xylan/chitin deacetylase (PgdA/CDA1 family)
MRVDHGQLAALIGEGRGFAAAYRGMYPPFVFGRELDARIAPIFYYHSVSRETFEGHLRYLQCNGYRTLVGDELYEDFAGAARSRARRVALSFDDGLEDLYTVVYPLLQEFRCTAIAYIVPAAVGTPGFVTWAQVEEMHASGCVDFQSHSMTHQPIFTSPQIVDFFHPDSVHFPPWDVAATSVPNNDNNNAQQPPYGAPIYTWRSRLSDSRRYLPDRRVHALCASFVAENGDPRLFKHGRWRRKLRNLVADFARDQHLADSYEDEAMQRRGITEEIQASKDAIERRLHGKCVRHFAFPWHQSGDLARRALVEAGYKTVAIGLSTERQPVALSDNTFEVTRLSGDFVPALPGTGRQPLWRIMLLKAVKRITGDAKHRYA